MSEFKYLDIDCAAWVRDTHHLRPMARGIYMDLLMLAWSMPKNRIPNDPKQLRELLHYLPAEMAVLDAVVRQFWKQQSGGKYLIQKRLNKEYRSALSRKRSAKNAANSRWDNEKKHNRIASTVTGTETDESPLEPPQGGNSLFSNSNSRMRSNGKRQGPVSDEFIARLGAALDRNAKRH
jgi:uncharacterized protein YdaU (DUF1376 family)